MRELLESTAFWGVALTICCYLFSLWLRKKLKTSLANPLILSMLMIVAVLLLCGIDYESYSKSSQPLSYLVTPATVCFAIPLYRQLDALRKNWLAILIGITSGVIANLVAVFGTHCLFRMTLAQHVTVLPNSVTTAIAVGVSEELGGLAPLTIAAVMVTAIFGTMVADLLFRFFRIKNPVAQGVALGTSTHILGTARALEMGELQGAMSSLAVVVTGLLTVALAPVYINWIY